MSEAPSCSSSDGGAWYGQCLVLPGDSFKTESGIFRTRTCPATLLTMEVMVNPEEVESNEKERLKMRIAVLEESVKSCEVECKASRETVVRLVSELERERRKAANSAAALDSLKEELDGVVVGRRSVEMETHTLAERLEASKRVTEAARRESKCLEKQVKDLEKKLHDSQGETQATNEKLQMFVNRLAGLLQVTSGNAAPPTERDVLQALDQVLTDTEARLRLASKQLSERTELQLDTLQRAQLAEQQVQDLRERLQAVEAELLTADVHGDGLRRLKQEYEDFLDQLSETMKVDGIAVDLGSDMRLKLILSRAEQLVKQEGTALVESKGLTYNLQRKLKSQKEQLESKGLHIQFLRKKVSDLEEDKRTRSALAADREAVEFRRLQKKLERLQSELKACKLSNTELKAQLSHNNELKSKVVEQSETVQEQKKRLDQLVEEKTKLEKKLNAVSSDLQSQEKQSREEQQQLHTLRQSLAQVCDRERQLVDFRMVVSQMLGLDATALPLTNYEIIKLLEALLHAHHHHHHLHHHLTVPCHCPAHAHIQDLPGSPSLDVSTCRSACAEGASPL